MHKEYGLIGYPLGHSFSGNYFAEKFAREGIADHSYSLFPLESINALPQLIGQHPALLGLNVTIPYKEQVLCYLDDRNGIPDSLDACNCIKIRSGKLYGYNTDVVGFRQSLEPLLTSSHDRALVLGTGGAAKAVMFVLDQLGISYRRVSREMRMEADLTYKDLNPDLIVAHPLIINTTPLGMAPNETSKPELPYEALSSRHFLYDLVYNPPLTRFLKEGQDRGAQIKNGHEMLVLQAEESWKIWQDSSR
jgi:shikimate dehydrogenase